MDSVYTLRGFETLGCNAELRETRKTNLNCTVWNLTTATVAYDHRVELCAPLIGSPSTLAPSRLPVGTE